MAQESFNIIRQLVKIFSMSLRFALRAASAAALSSLVPRLYNGCACMALNPRFLSFSYGLTDFLDLLLFALSASPSTVCVDGVTLKTN